MTTDSLDLDELRRELAALGQLDVEVIGNSMEPTLQVGEEIVVEATRRPRIGDVILYRGRSGLVAHRVILAAPWAQHFVHAGDRPGSKALVANRNAVIGRARVARKPPSLAQLRSAGSQLSRSVRGRARAAVWTTVKTATQGGLRTVARGAMAAVRPSRAPRP